MKKYNGSFKVVSTAKPEVVIALYLEVAPRQLLTNDSSVFEYEIKHSDGRVTYVSVPSEQTVVFCTRHKDED